MKEYGSTLDNCIPVHVDTILFKQFTNIQDKANILWTPGLIRTLDKFSTVYAWIKSGG